MGIPLITQPEDIIGGGTVIFRQPDQRPDRDLMDPFFIAAVDFPFAVEQIGDLLLCLVRVNAEIFKPLKKHVASLLIRECYYFVADKIRICYNIVAYFR